MLRESQSAILPAFAIHIQCFAIGFSLCGVLINNYSQGGLQDHLYMAKIYTLLFHVLTICTVNLL